jgi:hypothetical protein
LLIVFGTTRGVRNVIGNIQMVPAATLHPIIKP